jgi:RNA polymerase sigma-70 factor (ECF subfamily)
MFAEHGPFVCRTLRHLSVRESELDDVTQEVFLTVHRLLADYEEKGRARAWLYSICRRVVYTHRRKTLRWNEKWEFYPQHESATQPTQLEQIELQACVDAGYRVLECLTADQRHVFWLYEVEDVPMREIAEALGVHLQTAYARLYKARERVLAARRSSPLRST